MPPTRAAATLDTAPGPRPARRRPHGQPHHRSDPRHHPGRPRLGHGPTGESYERNGPEARWGEGAEAAAVAHGRTHAVLLDARKHRAE